MNTNSLKPNFIPNNRLFIPRQNNTDKNDNTLKKQKTHRPSYFFLPLNHPTKGIITNNFLGKTDPHIMPNCKNCKAAKAVPYCGCQFCETCHINRCADHSDDD